MISSFDGAVYRPRGRRGRAFSAEIGSQYSGSFGGKFKFRTMRCLGGPSGQTYVPDLQDHNILELRFRGSETWGLHHSE